MRSFKYIIIIQPWHEEWRYNCRRFGWRNPRYANNTCINSFTWWEHPYKNNIRAWPLIDYFVESLHSNYINKSDWLRYAYI